MCFRKKLRHDQERAALLSCLVTWIVCVGRKIVLGWALVFLIIAIVAGVFGFGGIAAASASIAQIIFYIFLVLLIISLVFYLIRGSSRV